MTNTYATLSNPLNPAKEETLRRLYSVIGSMQVVLLGAFARDLIFNHICGIEVPRATMDIDTCVQMVSWDHFDTACENLKAIGFCEDGPDHPEKMYDTNGQEVDLLPFGSLSEDGRTITWQTDSSPWTILGIQEAHDKAWKVRIDELELRVSPPCAMIYLKMLSTYDRPGDRRRKDTQDIDFVLEHYLDATGRERLRSDGSDADVMVLESGDIEKATARVVGRDIASMVEAETFGALSDILTKETESRSRCPIGHELAGYYQGSFSRARSILKAIRIGLEEGRS
jgi:predicted nucleotidyltransferase